MPVTFDKIAKKESTITFIYAGDEIKVIYRPNKFTPQFMAQAQAGELDDDQAIREVIVSWDIYEDQECTKMFPIERINEFGMDFLYQLSLAMASDMQPPEALTPQMRKNRKI